MIKKIILASGSKYRRVLLKKININCIAVAPGVDESAIAGESPRQLALRLAYEKANAVKVNFPNHLIIGSDQVVILENQQLIKPLNRTNTMRQLQSISGNRVLFYTSVCVLNSGTQKHFSDLDICSVKFKELSDKQIENYVDLDEPYDCAGGFKAEGLGIALISQINGGDPNALMGLPLIKLIRILEKFGVEVI